MAEFSDGDRRIPSRMLQLARNNELRVSCGLQTVCGILESEDLARAKARGSGCFARANARGPTLMLVGVLFVAGGCSPVPTRVRFEPVSAQHAIRIVNDNAAKVRNTLRAIGVVDGRFKTREGAQHSYHVRGVLFFHQPIFLRFDLKKLGNRQFLLGCNDRDFWVFSAADDDYHCGKHADPDDWPADLPLRPDQLVNAIGLGSIPSTDFRGAPFQRVVEDYQQVLFLAPREDGGRYLEREYWVDRYAPRLLRRVVFRDEDGRVEMETQLADYRPLDDSGALLPHELLTRWPNNDAHMRFRVSKWTVLPEIAPGDIQFSTPPECEDDRP